MSKWGGGCLNLTAPQPPIKLTYIVIDGCEHVHFNLQNITDVVQFINSLLLQLMKNFKGLHNLPILINKPDAKIS